MSGRTRVLLGTVIAASLPLAFLHQASARLEELACMNMDPGLHAVPKRHGPSAVYSSVSRIAARVCAKFA